MRPPPAFNASSLALSLPSRNPSFKLDLHVVTPLFGGSASAGEIDPERPINAKSIRGQLRFWWRATSGCKFSSPQDLFRAEAEIWGGVNVPHGTENISKASQVELQVDLTYVSKTTSQGKEFPNYALFPFRGQLDSRRTQPGKCIAGLGFTLRVFCPESVRGEVAKALQAWILFGGVGARTRRGCGSIFCSNWENNFGEPVPNSLENVKIILNQLVADSSASGRASVAWPILAGATLYARSSFGQDPIEAWKSAVELMQNFRQGVGLARKSGSGSKPGTSLWPEPHSIRKRTGKTGCHYNACLGELDYFPRADLGLPIVFQFRGCSTCPGQHVLGIGQGGTGRMASPLILKPLALSQHRAVPILLILNAPHAWESDKGVWLVNGDPNRANLDDNAKNGKVTPLKGKSVREAFLDYAKNQKWDRIWP